MTNEELVELIQRGDDGRLPQLWKQVRRFIAWRARHFYKKMKLTGKTHGCELEDLIQSGYLALVAAVRYFKPREGYKFLTYLNYTLLSAFHEAMGLRTSKRDWLDYAISLDQPVGEDGNTSLLEMLGDLTPESADVSEQVVEDVWTQELRAVLDEAMLILRKEQRELLNMLYYFEIGVDEAAEMWGLSRQRIYQMESRALSQIRESKYGDELREFLPDIRYVPDYYKLTKYRRWAETGRSEPESFLLI
jgi:RNA polymerase sigma factor (sigma-70 family)